MLATRRGKILRSAVVLIVGAFALSIFETSTARSGGGNRRKSDEAPRVLPGMQLHMHGDQAHYHELEATAEDRKPKIGKEGRGLVYKGLKRARRHERCRGGYQIEVSDRPECTHGPDEAPEGVDVRNKPSVADLRAADNASSQAILPCYGDGSSGPRVQAVYVHTSDSPNRFSELGRLFPEWASRVDAVFARSAAQTGGTRHVRWVTNADCTLDVASVTLSPAGADSLNNTIAELKAQGYNRSDRKYLVWADAGRYCGIAEVRNDDRADGSNQNNFGPSFARVDAACWGREASVEAHELMHTFGGIQNSAPHATGGWHCADENDRMCLADGPTVALAYTCPPEHENLFDCGNDDYFSTAPQPGSYLATHWNAANSSYLSADMPESCRITAQATTSAAKRKNKKHRRNHRRGAGAEDVLPSSCVPQNVFG